MVSHREEVISGGINRNAKSSIAGIPLIGVKQASRPQGNAVARASRRVGWQVGRRERYCYYGHRIGQGTPAAIAGNGNGIQPTLIDRNRGCRAPGRPQVAVETRPGIQKARIAQAKRIGAFDMHKEPGQDLQLEGVVMDTITIAYDEGELDQAGEIIGESQERRGAIGVVHEGFFAIGTLPGVGFKAGSKSSGRNQLIGVAIIAESLVGADVNGYQVAVGVAIAIKVSCGTAAEGNVEAGGVLFVKELVDVHVKPLAGLDNQGGKEAIAKGPFAQVGLPIAQASERAEATIKGIIGKSPGIATADGAAQAITGRIGGKNREIIVGFGPIERRNSKLEYAAVGHIGLEAEIEPNALLFAGEVAIANVVIRVVEVRQARASRQGDGHVATNDYCAIAIGGGLGVRPEWCD